MPPSVVNALILSPDNLWLDRGGKADLSAFAVDETGARVSVPNGTQVRLNNSAVATASLSGDLVHVTALAAGHTDVWLTKGSMASNTTIVNVRQTPVPSSITIHV